MIILNIILCLIVILFALSVCEMQEKVDTTVKKVEQIESQIAIQKEATSYFEYGMYILFLIFALWVLIKIGSYFTKILNRG